MPNLLPAVAYAGRVRETGTGARTALVAAALQPAASRTFQTTPRRSSVRPTVDIIAPSLVIRGEVKQLSPGTGETTLPCNFPELSGDLPVVFTVRILPARCQCALRQAVRCGGKAGSCDPAPTGSPEGGDLGLRRWRLTGSGRRPAARTASTSRR